SRCCWTIRILQARRTRTTSLLARLPVPRLAGRLVVRVRLAWRIRMVQQHLDRLTSIDASFLHQEGRSSHMHIGGVPLFQGPAPAFEDYLDHVRGRLHLVPRYRQKLATPPLETGRPLWVDDPSFNLEYHVRHTALPP